MRNYFQNKVFSQDYRFVWLDLPRRAVAERRALAPRSALAALFPWGAF